MGQYLLVCSEQTSSQSGHRSGCKDALKVTTPDSIPLSVAKSQKRGQGRQAVILWRALPGTLQLARIAA